MDEIFAPLPVGRQPPVNFADGTFSGRDTRGDTAAFCNYLAGT
jgi:hypothetical protein